MSFELVERWGEPGAPVVREAEIRGAFDAYFRSIEPYGITRDNYLICARHALVASRRMIEEQVLRSRETEMLRTATEAAEAERLAREQPSERTEAKASRARKCAEWAAARYKAAKDENERPRWSTIIGTVRSVLNEYGRAGWTIFWATLRTLEDVFGTAERSTWERLRLLREIGWVLVWQRWRSGKEPQHVYEEGRSNVYFLRVPEEVWAFWVETPEARRLLANLAARGASAAAPPSAASPPISRRPSAGPTSTRTRPSTGQSSTTDNHGPTSASSPSWFRDLFLAERTKRYASDAGPIQRTTLEKIEAVLRGAAETAYNACLKGGRQLPPMATVRDEIALLCVRAYLEDRGGEDFLVKQQHPIAPFVKDCEKLSARYGEQWRLAYLKAHPVPPLPTVDFAPVPASQSLAAANRERIEPPASAPLSSSHVEPSPIRKPASGGVLPEFAAFERRALASSMGRTDPDGDFDTLTSATSDPPPK